MLQNACTMFQNVPECIQNISECIQNFTECFGICRMFQNVPECIQNVPEYSGMHAECSRIFLNVPGATRLTAWMSSCTGESRLDFVWWWMMTFLILVQNWGANLTLCISLPLHFIAIKELAVNNCCRAQIQVRSRSKSSEIDLSHTVFLVFTTHPPPPTSNFFLGF